MSYIAVLGRQPEFGLVELESVLGPDQIKKWGHAAVISQSIDAKRLGGTVKIGRVIARQPFTSLEDIKIDLASLPQVEGKLNFGVSYYGSKVSPARLQAFGLTLKKQLKDRGSVRFVAPATHELTAAQLKYNQIPAKGFELIIATYNNEVILALTEQYQDIDWYSQRDYDRPARSAKVGMLPPKLAQILVNTTSSDHIYDPFCGTGVILQEALLLGRQVSGSDLSPEMVEATQTNLQWLKNQTNKAMAWQVTLADARKVTLPEGSAVVTEGYLGPAMHRGQKPSQDSIQELALLFQDCLKNFAKQQSAGNEVTICLPTWDGVHLPIIDQLPDLGYTLKDFVAADSRNLIYRRPDQSVGRQVLILTRS